MVTDLKLQIAQGIYYLWDFW